MKITTISYSKTFPLPMAYSNEKIGAEASIDETEDVTSAMKRLIHFVEEIHYANNSDNSESMLYPTPISLTEKPQKTVLDDILACTFIEGVNGLKGWYPIAKSNPKWLAVYNRKLAELTNK